jgi:mono/diheme cytochrome c family protein
MFCSVLLELGCTDKGSFQAMAQQPRYEALENSDFYADQSSARAPQADTVARGELRDDTLLFTGKVNGQVADTFPYAISADVLLHGQQRFNIYCAPCHDMTGGGNGPVVRAGFPHPPSFHEQRLRDAPVGHFFDVITNGQRTMPSYASQVPVRDRWSIISYIRALQLSQNARIEDVPAQERNRLGEPPK